MVTRVPEEFNNNVIDNNDKNNLIFGDVEPHGKKNVFKDVFGLQHDVRLRYCSITVKYNSEVL